MADLFKNDKFIKIILKFQIMKPPFHVFLNTLN